MQFTLGLISGIILTMAVIAIFIKIDELVNKKIKFTRKGLYKGVFTSTNSLNKFEADVLIEIGEIESSGTKSKVKVINIQSTNGLTAERKKDISGIIDNTWIDSNSIEWLDFTSTQRDEKIDNILN